MSDVEAPISDAVVIVESPDAENVPFADTLPVTSTAIVDSTTRSALTEEQLLEREKHLVFLLENIEKEVESEVAARTNQANGWVPPWQLATARNTVLEGREEEITQLKQDIQETKRQLESLQDSNGRSGLHQAHVINNEPITVTVVAVEESLPEHPKYGKLRFLEENEELVLGAKANVQYLLQAINDEIDREVANRYAQTNGGSWVPPWEKAVLREEFKEAKGERLIELEEELRFLEEWETRYHSFKQGIEEYRKRKIEFEEVASTALNPYLNTEYSSTRAKLEEEKKHFLDHIPKLTGCEAWELYPNLFDPNSVLRQRPVKEPQDTLPTHDKYGRLLFNLGNQEVVQGAKANVKYKLNTLQKEIERQVQAAVAEENGSKRWIPPWERAALGAEFKRDKEDELADLEDELAFLESWEAAHFKFKQVIEEFRNQKQEYEQRYTGYNQIAQHLDPDYQAVKLSLEKREKYLLRYIPTVTGEQPNKLYPDLFYRNY